MKRTALKRSGPIARRTPVKTRRSKLRRVAVDRNRAYMDWLKERRCIACSARNLIYRDRLCATSADPIDPAHTAKTNGRGSKGSDLSCVPLCRHHHDEMDGKLSTAITTKAQFAAKYGLDLAHEAKAHYAAFLIETEYNRPATVCEAQP